MTPLAARLVSRCRRALRCATGIRARGGVLAPLIALLGVAAALVAPAHAQDAVVRATVDRNTVRVNESFTYVITTEGDTRGDPDFTPLEEHFEILSGPERRFVIGNFGLSRVRQSAEWRLQLLPKDSGKLTVPPLAIGEYTTNAIELDVLPAPTAAEAGGADYFIELEASPETIYAQAQAIVTVRLFVGVAADRPTLSVPGIAGGEAIVETLRDDVRFVTTRAGRSYSVHERRYAVFPQQSGTLTIGPVLFEAVVQTRNRSSHMVRYPSETLEIEVQPPVAPPASMAGAAWLPARSLTISETWSDDVDDLTAGVPITRTILLEADGLLETQLPALDVPAQTDVRQYAEQPELSREQSREGLRVRRSVRYAVIAQTPGEIELAGIEMPWWNVTAERWEVARLPPRTLHVARGPAASSSPPQPVIEPAVAPPTPAVAAAPAPSFWPYVSLALALGWAATLVLWWRSRAAHGAGAEGGDAHAEARTAASPPPAAAALAKSERRALRALRAACAVNDAPAARAALLEWASSTFAEAPRSLGALAACVPDAASRAILDLEAHLYGAVATPWHGEPLRAALAVLDASGRSTPRAAPDPLLPLYR